MPKFQALTAIINLAGDRDQQVYRGTDNPITLPEAFVLRTIHGGSDHVHSLVSIEVAPGHPLSGVRDDASERLRLYEIYGKGVVDAVFPPSIPLPVEDHSIQTAEEVEAVRVASEKAVRAVRAKKSGKADPAPAAPAVPAITDLPNV